MLVCVNKKLFEIFEMYRNRFPITFGINRNLIGQIDRCIDDALVLDEMIIR